MIWERGVNRIANLEMMTSDIDCEKQDMDPVETPSGRAYYPPSYINSIQIHDIWQEFKVRFTIYDPLYQPEDEMWLKPNPDSGITAVPMRRTTFPEQWLQSKYGKPVHLWECEMYLKNEHNDGDGQFRASCNIRFTYSYVKKTSRGQNSVATVQERKPERLLFVDNPVTYNAEITEPNHIANQYWKIQDVVHIVNGVIEKADGTFLQSFFFNEIRDSKLTFQTVLGSCPLHESDIKKLVQETKVNAVLNLQTGRELLQRGIGEDILKMRYVEQGVQFYRRFNIVDDHFEYYCHQLYQACKLLSHLHKSNLKVFIHCTSGYTRAPTLFLAYLSLFKPSRVYTNIQSNNLLIQQCLHGAAPNIQAVEHCVTKYGSIVNEKQRLVEEGERNRLELIAK